MHNLLPRIITLSKTFFRPAMLRMQISNRKKRNLKTTEYHHMTTQIQRWCFFFISVLFTQLHSSFIATNEIRDFSLSQLISFSYSYEYHIRKNKQVFSYYQEDFVSTTRMTNILVLGIDWVKNKSFRQIRYFFLCLIYRDKLQTQKKKRQTHKHCRHVSSFLVFFFFVSSINLFTQHKQNMDKERREKKKRKLMHMHNTKHYLQIQ